jgi:phage gp46-like protein
MTDYKLIIDDNGNIDIDYDGGAKDFVLCTTPTHTLINNLILSLYIRPGELLDHPSFGSRRHSIKTVSTQTIKDLADYDRQATQWIVDAGRAKTIDIQTWRDDTNPAVIRELITATLPDDTQVPFETFLRVV